MPLYDYECDGGHRFDQIRQIRNRHEAVCPMCKRTAHLRVSLSSFRMATPFTVVNSDGEIVHHQPDGGNSVPPVEDSARDLKKEYQYAESENGEIK